MSLLTSITRRILRPTASHAKKWVRHHNYEGEYTPTTVNMITKEDDSVLYVSAYNPQGFRLSTDFRVYGPCVMFPKSVIHWNVRDAASVNIESFSLLTLLEPKLDIVIIGKGDFENKIDEKVIRYLMSRRINVEILPTDQACGTFNFLNSERRYVAACLIPPRKMTSSFGSGSMTFGANPLPVRTEGQSEAIFQSVEDEEERRKGFDPSEKFTIGFDAPEEKKK